MAEFKTDEDAPCVAYVSKMVAVPAKELPHNKRPQGHQMSADEARELARKKRAEFAKARAAAEAREQSDVEGMTSGVNGMSVNERAGAMGAEPEPEEEPDQLIGFARLYSGTLKVGDSIYVLSPKYTPTRPHGPPAPTRVTITALYLMMGRALESLQSVPAGCVFGVGGLAGHVLKNGTLSSVSDGAVNLAGVRMGGEPIVRVALEPVDPRDLSKVITGMKLLEQADPCARYEVLSSGEHVVATAGELHLERCLKDLRERFARCEIQASEPIVPYRESIVSAPDMAPPKNKDLQRGEIVAVSASKQLTLRLRVRPLPEELTECVDKHAATIRRLFAEQKRAEEASGDGTDAENTTTIPAEQATNDPLIAEDVDVDDDSDAADTADTLSRSEFRDALLASAKDVSEPDTWRRAIERITAFGPRRSGPNLLIDSTSASICRNFWDEHALTRARSNTASSGSGSLTPADLADRIAYAFQLATAQGPLCQEPLQGVAVFIEDVQITGAPNSSDESSTPSRADAGRLTGETIRAVRSSVHAGFLDWSPRLLLAMYSCEIQAGTEVLGKVYAVVTRRRGKILAEALHEGTPFFTIIALLPVAESFGFATEIRNRTSGNASPQLRFAGFVPLDLDPFWVPSTEDELEDLGELADRENVAKRYVDSVRRRKGLLVKELRRVEGEKARTLKK
jgi:ribosome assembly protein 1